MHKFILFNKAWFRTLFLVTFAVYLYVFMEWIFFITKPSFMSALNTAQDIEIFLLTSFILELPGVIAVLSIWGASKLFNKRSYETVFIWIGAGIPAFISAALVFILIDNFTYTVFGFGVVSTSGIWRSVYALLFILLFIVFFRNILKFSQSSSKISRSLSYCALFLLFISTIVFILQIPRLQLGNEWNIGKPSSDLPNIILIGIDGVNAENMSVYGYTRDTTPNITELAQNALIADNAFSNSGNTGGSLTSLLTGKLPTETRVVYPPDILMGEDAYQHLPGILKQLGYYTVQVTMPQFGDAYARNIRDGFDIANFRSENIIPFEETIKKLGGGSGFYFSTLIVQRVTDRILHAFYIKKMDNPYEIVTQPTAQITEEERFNAMLSYLDEAKGPIFLHVHMLGTHGAFFEPQEHLFSEGEVQDQPWMIDFYDDAIRDFDNYFKILFEHLSETGKINNTLVILYSDHGMNWNSHNRVPLILWFPNHQFAGKIHENVQLIDVAPTILDYLGVSQPVWMHGQSILADNLPSARNIISVDIAGEVVVNIESEGGWAVDETKISPPFYQLGAVNLIVCDRWFSLNLRTPKLTYGEVDGSTVVCNEDDIPTLAQAQKLILQNLTDNGYNTTSYPTDIPHIPSSSTK